MQNYKHMWRTALIFYGRERRSVYWSATLTNLGLTLIAILIFGSIKTISWISYVYIIAMILPQTAITVRRLHDVNSSGKKLLWLLIPILGVIMIFIELTFDSTPETNIYGESLKYPKDNKVILSPDALAKPKKNDEIFIEDEVPLDETIDKT